MAIRTISAAGGLWNATTTWDEGIVPTALDDVVARGDGTSGNLNVNPTGASCKSLVLTNYNANLQLSTGLTVKGNVTFVNTMTITASAGVGLTLDTTCTITSAGLTLPCGLFFGGTNPTITLADNWATSVGAGVIGISLGSSSASTINGNQLSTNGDILIGSPGSLGTTTLVMTGTSSIRGNGILRNNLTFNAPGETITIGAAGVLNFNYRTGTLTYLAGTVQMFSSSVVLVIGASTTLNTNGITWSNVTVNAASTITLTSDLTISGTLLTSTGAVVINGAARNVNVGGNLTVNNSLSGTASITMNGTGTWSSTGFSLTNNFIINSPGPGTITISGTVYYNTGTITYTAGTVVTTGSTLNLNASATLNTNGITWNNLTAISTQTMNSNLNISGTLTTSESVTFVSVGGALLNPSGALTSTSFATTNQTVTIPNNITITNFSTNVSGNINKALLFNGFNVNVTGNFTYNGGDSSIFIGGTTVFNLIGTGTLSTATLTAGSIRSPLNINTSGTITLGANFVCGSNLTYTQGNFVTTGSSVIFMPSLILNNFDTIYWDSIIRIGYNSSTITLNSNLNCREFVLGGTVTLNGPGIVHAQNLTGNNSVSGTVNVFVTLNTDVHVYGVFTIATVNQINIYNSTIHCYGDINISNTNNTWGNTIIRVAGSGTFTTTAPVWRQYPLVFDTPGKVVLVGNFNWNLALTSYPAAPITYIRGNIIAKDATLYMGNLSTTLTNMHKIAWKNVILTSGITYTMNEFFSGTPSLQTPIVATSTTSNYIVNFTDGFEKIAKFIKPSNLTLGTNSRLLITTDKAIGINSRTNSGNIRYINQHPNGVAKNGSLLTPSMTYDTGGLLPDPAFNKS